jgi:hypothetical protein
MSFWVLSGSDVMVFSVCCEWALSPLTFLWYVDGLHTGVVFFGNEVSMYATGGCSVGLSGAIHWIPWGLLYHLLMFCSL